MARIRTVKPEFWTDEKLTECSLSARLMFIGMLNFADDKGNMSYSAKRLKMQIFPADVIDTQPLLDELIAHGIVIEYSVNDEKFLHIKGFTKHQVINRPSTSAIPAYQFDDCSLNTHGVITDGKEGKGKERNIEPKGSVASQHKKPTCPTSSIVDLYHELLPELPTARLMPENRKKAISKFWSFVLTSQKSDGTRRATTADEALTWVGEYFKRARDNDFLMGRGGKSAGHENWQCDIDFLVTDKGMKHVIEKTKEAA